MTTTFIASAVFAQATATTASLIPSTGVSTTAAETPNKFGGSFTHISTKGIKYDPTGSELSTQNVFALTYKPEEITYGASIKGVYSVVGKEQKAKPSDESYMKQSDMVFRDLKLAVGKSIGSLGSSDAATLKGVAWLPTSDKSRESNQYAAVGAELYVPYTLDHGFSTQLAFFPIYSLIKGDDTFFNETYGEVRYSFNDKLSTYAGVYHDFTGSAGETTKKSDEVLSPALGLDVSFPKIVDLTFEATQSRNILHPTGDVKRKAYAMMAPEETTVSVQAVFKF
jgi:hypothetical protein